MYDFIVLPRQFRVDSHVNFQVKKHEKNSCYWVGVTLGYRSPSLCAKKGYEVIGLERDNNTVTLLKSGKSHIQDQVVEQLLSEAHVTGRFYPTIELTELSDCEAYLICVPTPVDENFDPDLTPLLDAAKDISPYLKKGDLVVVEINSFPRNL